MINVPGRRLTTVQAAARLGVKPATLYAYVSRGLLSRDRTPEGSSFDALEVERLAQGARRAGGVVRAERPLAFVTELTLIEDGHLYYRGRDAVALSADAGFEAVAEWLWAGTWPDDCAGWADGADEARAAAMAATAALPGRPSVLASLSAAAVAAGSADPMRNDRSSVGVAVVGRRLLTAMVAALGAGAAAASRSGGGVAAGLAAALAARSGVDPPGPEGLAALEAAMVVMADHEIAASTLAVRVAASFGADPYAAVVSGLGAVGGTRHGGASVAVHGLLRDAEAEGADVAVGDRLGVGERTAGGAPLPGFGMDLYPGGDPRGAALLERVLALPGPAGRRRAIEGVLAAVAGRDIAPPNCDFGLGALAYLLGLGREAGEAVFVVARTAGWLAHAAEEYRFRTTFRVRAAYTGPRPPTPGPGRPAS